MIFRALALLFAAFAALAAPAAAQTGDAPEILAAVLAYEAGYFHNDRRTCVALRTEGLAFDRTRQHRRWLREAAALPGASAELRREAEARGNPLYEWVLPADGRRVSFGELPRLDPPAARAFDAAIGAMLAAEPESPAPLELPAVPPPLRPGPSLVGSCGRLTLSAPAIAGDIAFVETGYVCGGLCGNGWLYALRREGGRWRLAGLSFTWVS